AVEDRTIIAVGKALYQGQPVVAVAAVDEETAREAMELIRVDYQVLSAVFDPEEAMRPGAPLVHEDLLSYGGESKQGRSGNVYTRLEATGGDLARGFAESDHVFEDTFRTQMVHQGYIEPHAMTAQVDNSGRISVWTTTQAPYTIRHDLATVLEVPINRIRVVPTEVGGGFGGKLAMTYEPLAVLLAQRANRPVKLVMSREEEFIAARPRSRIVAHIKTGVKKDGTMLARESTFIYDAGAFGGAPVFSGINFGRGPYHVPNYKLTSYGVYTNHLGSGSYRAPGAPQVTFAYESATDMIGRRLGIDPLELRLKNALEEGNLNTRNERIGPIGLKKTLISAAARADWGKPLGPNRGRGIASGEWITASGATTATIAVNEDGTISVLTGAVDITGSKTSLAQVAAEEMGVSMEEVTIASQNDTDATPYTAGSGGSRVTYMGGTAIRQATADAREQLFALASDTLEASPDDLELRDKKVSVKGSPEKAVTLAELAQKANSSRGGPVLGRGSVARLGPAPTFSTQVAEVEVDTETGQVRVLRLVAAQDVGFAINPTSVEGQMEGGAVQGLGYALTEDVMLGEGHVRNPNLTDYRVFTALDVPVIETIMVEEASAEGPYGARGVGEPPLVPTAPAVANAVYDAVGVRITELPITSEKVLAALRAKQGKE
ncbi:MAG TPA: xanthine dehydrogenase family protein molybdopterin-binding subunit, partial [Dehalococcoidia bacterium]|nr:xanthine dehydrogenase family protein molybdopterin-binding subunit [Dehalococcoidia bacterium]